MTTVDGLIDRLYRTWLYPPDAQPAASALVLAMDATELETISLTAFVVPEDALLMRIGALVEVDRELMRIETWDSATLIGTVSRGKFGTTPAAHTAASEVILGAAYPRQSAFEFVGDQIQQLYPRLFTVDVAYLTQTSSGVAPLEDNLATEVIEIWPGSSMSFSGRSMQGRIVEFHPGVGGRAVLTNMNVGSFWIRYRRRMDRPTTGTEELRDDLGVEEMWAGIIMAGVAADFFAGKDLTASHTEWVQNTLQTENIQVGTRSALSRALLAYRDAKLKEAKAEMVGEDANRIRVHMRDPMEIG